MHKALLAGAAIVTMITAAQAARADYAFSGSGSSGTLVSSTETWLLGGPASPPGDTEWGSPGGGMGSAAYGEAQAAVDFEIAFNDATLDPSQIGSLFSEFKNTSTSTIWTPVFNPLTPSSIEFLAPSGTDLATGQAYFVNIALTGSLSSVSFTGAWTTGTSAVPEPSSLALLGAGLLGIGLLGFGSGHLRI